MKGFKATAANHREVQRALWAVWFFFGLTAFAVIVITGASLRNRFHYEVGRTQVHDQALAEVLAQHVDRSLHGAAQIFSGIDSLVAAHDSGYPPRDPVVRSALMEYMNENSYLMDILVLNKSGDIVHWTGPGEPPFVRDREYATVHFAENPPELFLGKPKLSRVHKNKWFFGMSRAIRNDRGEISRIIVAILDLDYFAQAFENVELDAGQTLTLQSDNGWVYARAPNGAQWTGRRLPPQEPPLPPTTTRKRLFQSIFPLGTGDQLTATAVIEGHSLQTVVTSSPEHLFTTWMKNSYGLAFVAGAFLVVGFIFTFCLAAAARRKEHERRELRNLNTTNEQLIGELRSALDEIKVLRGIIPICSYCKKIRDDGGAWNRLEEYVMKHSEAKFSHGICPKCKEDHFPEPTDNPEETSKNK